MPRTAYSITSVGFRSSFSLNDSYRPPPGYIVLWKYSFISTRFPVTTTFSALITTTKSPRSWLGVNVGLCLPRMMWAIRGRAQKVTTPTFMALAGRDCVCDNDAARKFFDRLGTDDKRRGDYGESMHSLEYGPNRAQLLEDWLGWIEAHESGAGNKGELNEK